MTLIKVSLVSKKISLMELQSLQREPQVSTRSVSAKVVFSPWHETILESSFTEEKRVASLVRFLPVLAAVSPIITFIISYLLAVVHSKSYPALMPYISQTGNVPPASCVFTLGLCFTALLFLPTVFLQYQRLTACISVILGHIKDEHENSSKNSNSFTKSFFGKARSVAEYRANNLWWCLNYNRAALVFGLLGILGVLIVAAFQESKVRNIHYGAAALAFTCIMLYVCYITFILYKIRYHCFQSNLFKFRLMMAIVTVILFFLMAVCVSKVREMYDPIKHDEHHPFEADCPYNSYFLISSFAEWCLSITSFTYIGTFYFDFKHISLDILVNVRKVPGQNELALLR
jgi:hypothetical protein